MLRTYTMCISMSTSEAIGNETLLGYLSTEAMKTASPTEKISECQETACVNITTTNCYLNRMVTGNQNMRVALYSFKAIQRSKVKQILGAISTNILKEYPTQHTIGINTTCF